jgi:hypothetical protein
MLAHTHTPPGFADGPHSEIIIGATLHSLGMSVAESGDARVTPTCKGRHRGRSATPPITGKGQDPPRGPHYRSQGKNLNGRPETHVQRLPLTLGLSFPTRRRGLHRLADPLQRVLPVARSPSPVNPRNRGCSGALGASGRPEGKCAARVQGSWAAIRRPALGSTGVLPRL